MLITIKNIIGSIRNVLGIVTDGLKMWLPFERTDILGEEVIVNGDFAIASGTGLGWTASGGATTTGGVGFLASSPASFLVQNNLVSGKTYYFSIEAKTDSSGNIKISNNGVNFFTNTSLSSSFTTFTGFFTANANDLTIGETGSGGIYVDNVSVKEVTQVAPDTSGNSNNATLYTGKALSFDGVNDYVDLGLKSNPSTNMTFACWLNPVVSASTSYQTIIDYGKFNAWLEDNDTLVIYTNTSQVAVNYTISDLNNKWSRLVVSVSGTTTSVYIDGTLIAAKTTTALSDSASQSDIGRDGTTRYYEGKLSDLQIYDVAWTQADVTFDYNNPQHLITDNPSIVKTYGSEIVTDGGFDDPSKWNANTGWTVGGGKASVDSSSTTALRQTLSVTKGKIYDLTFEISDYVEGSLQFGFNQFNIAETSDNLPNFSENGVYNYRVVALGDNINVYMYAINASEFSIDNLSLKEETSLNISNLKGYWHLSEGAGSFAYNSAVALGSELVTNGDFNSSGSWSPGTGWTIDTVNGKAKVDNGATTQLTQSSLPITNGKTYFVSFQISDYVSGSFQPQFGGSQVIASLSANGVYSYTVTSSVTNTILYLYGVGDCEFSIDYISIKEVSVGTINGATSSLRQSTIPQLGLMDWSKPTIGSDVVTLISDPNDPSKDVLDNTVRLREHSFNLDGSGYAEVADADSLDFGTSAFTIQFWAKPNSIANNMRMVTKGVTGNGEWMISFSSTDNVRVFAEDSDGNSLDTSTTFATLSVNTWAMVTVVVDTPNDKILFYKDNQATPTEKTGASWSGTFNNSRPLRVGDHYASSIKFDGLIDDVRVYNKVLSSDEVEQNYKVGEVSHKTGSSFSDDFSGDYGN